MLENYQEALQKIMEAKESHETTLNLSSLGLRQVPKEILELKQLKRLYLQHNQLSTLPAEMGKLSQLQEVNLSHNQLGGIPKSFGKLNHLRVVNLANNRLTSLPKPLRFLKNLQKLHLNDNKISSLPSYLCQTERLQELYVSNNPIRKLPADIDLLKQLQILDAEGCDISNLHQQIGSLVQLRKLLLADNQINALPPTIGNLYHLEVLDLRNNHLSTLPKEIEVLKNLKPNQTDKEWDRGLNLIGNRFSAPDEVFARDPQGLIQYIFDLQASKLNKPLLEAKLIFIGSGAVGKTSLIRRLTTGEFDRMEPKTDGIGIHDWFVRRGNNERVRLHVWDFGGQEIMHATHKFFMTSRSAYVLVINPRAEDKYGDSELEYWLKLIRSYAGEVPIVVVANKCEVHRIDIPKGEITDKYPNIIGFVETSCVENTGIGELKRLIKRAVGQLPHIDDLLPQSYFDIKQVLEERNDDYISYEEYEKLCKEVDSNFGKESMSSLMRLLHDLGVMLNFGKADIRLGETQVLNPEWVTKGVYQIISSHKLIRRKGKLTVREIIKILEPDKYPSERERFYIMDMMARFELCYQVPDVRDTFFVPGAFPIDRPKIDWKYSAAQTVRFQYHYDVMPSSIMSRFIVKVHHLIRNRDYWRNGVVIRKSQCDAFIKADPEERRIYINIAGRGNKRDLLSFIRAQFEVIHSRLSNIEIKSKIPVDEEGRVVLDYDDLLFYEEVGEEYILVSALRKKMLVRDLLMGIETNQDRERQRQAKEANPTVTQPLLSTSNSRDDYPMRQHWYETLWIKAASVVIFLAALAELTGFDLRNIYNSMINLFK